MTNQNITYTVPSDERIIAQNGDMIAFVAFRSKNNPQLQATSFEGIVFKYRRLRATTLNPGMTFFTSNTFEATFSISVATSTE